MPSDEPLPSIMPAEEKELARVHKLLCDYHSKRKVLRELRPKQERVASLRSKLDDEDGGDLAVAAELQRLDVEIAALREKVSALEERSDGKISDVDIAEAMKTLGKRCTKIEIADMIWEVDENLDGFVDWDEMRIMFERNISDKSGLEPSKLFNLVQFMIFDNDENGLVSVDETTNMLYARYGRVQMESKLKELFGEDMTESGTQGGEITFPQYLQAVERIQLKTFINSSTGKAQIAKAGSAKILLGCILPDGVK